MKRLIPCLDSSSRAVVDCYPGVRDCTLANHGHTVVQHFVHENWDGAKTLAEASQGIEARVSKAGIVQPQWVVKNPM